MLGVTLRWTSIPSGGGGGSNILSCFMLQKPGYALAVWASLARVPYFKVLRLRKRFQLLRARLHAI